MEALPNGTFWAELPNGHRVRAFLAARLRQRALRLSPGDRVTLEMSPFDMSKGRVTAKAN